MKILLIVTLFFINFLFANYNYSDKNSGKIDMHGGKSSNLLDTNNSFQNSNINSIGINKPKAPEAPKPLIKEEKKEIKN